MSKSINEYYSEKMKKLLEMQKSNAVSQLPSANTTADNSVQKKSEGRNYYDSFRSKVGSEGAGERAERTVIDDIREGKPPRRYKKPESEPEKKQSPVTDEAKANENEKPKPKKPAVAPEQTIEDKRAESEKQIEAMQTAKRARSRRNARDLLISVGLIVAVLVAMCVVAYRLLFVINDISVKGASVHSEEDILTATGVRTGDHLYSFSSREVGNLLMLRCPEISSVDVERTPLGKIEFIVTEESAAFYADFYGEFRLLSPTLRILGSVTEEAAKEQGCIKLVLPDISNATAGLTPKFADIRDDSYIYKVCEKVLASKLSGRVGSIDLCEKYDVSFTVDGKYLVNAGSFESMDSKLSITAAVLENEMFENNVKARIDVSDLSETSVVVDENLRVD